MTEVMVCCGVGGAGKTTVSAALGVRQALEGRRAVVLTIDPARRLADALGLASLGNRPTQVSIPDARGSLDALMLDSKGTWDEVIRRFSPDAKGAERLLANRYYRAVSTRLSGSHEYMAIEKLFELVDCGRWDVVLVDTPPARHVLDFLHAPERIRRVFDHTVLSALVEPGSGLIGVASRRAVGLLGRIAGKQVMTDISEFFRLVGTLSGGFRERSEQVARLLRSSDTRFFLVSHADAPERNDTIRFLRTLRNEEMHFAGFLLNRVAHTPPATTKVPLPDTLSGIDEESWAVWRTALADLLNHAQERTKNQRASASALSLAGGGAPVWLVPELHSKQVRTIDGLVTLAASLPPSEPPC